MSALNSAAIAAPELLTLDKHDTQIIHDLYGSAMETCLQLKHETSATNIICTLAAAVGDSVHFTTGNERAATNKDETNAILYGRSLTQPSSDSIFGALIDITHDYNIKGPIPLEEVFLFQAKCLSIPHTNHIFSTVPSQYQPTICALDAAKEIQRKTHALSIKALWGLRDLTIHALTIGIAKSCKNIPNSSAVHLATDIIVGVATHKCSTLNTHSPH